MSRTAESAWEMAENWNLYRAPTFAELEAMTDDDLRTRIHRLVHRR